MVTATDFQRWESKAKTMADAALVWSANDCREAAEAMDSIDRHDGGDRAGKYRDEACAYRSELNRRMG